MRSARDNGLNSGKGKRVVRVLATPETEALSRVGVGLGVEGEPLTALAPAEAAPSPCELRGTTRRWPGRSATPLPPSIKRWRTPKGRRGCCR